MTGARPALSRRLRLMGAAVSLGAATMLAAAWKFLGVGNRRIAVDWDALHFATATSKDDHITLDLTRDQVKAAPEYKDKQSVVVLGAAGGLEPLPIN